MELRSSQAKQKSDVTLEHWCVSRLHDSVLATSAGVIYSQNPGMCSAVTGKAALAEVAYRMPDST